MEKWKPHTLSCESCPVVCVFYHFRFSPQKHHNPCFLRGAGETKYSPLVRDKWVELHHGDYISLLPDSLIYRVELRLKNEVWNYLLESCWTLCTCDRVSGQAMVEWGRRYLESVRKQSV